MDWYTTNTILSRLCVPRYNKLIGWMLFRKLHKLEGYQFESMMRLLQSDAIAELVGVLQYFLFKVKQF